MLAFGWPLHKSLDFCPRTVTHSLAPIGQQIVSLQAFLQGSRGFYHRRYYYEHRTHDLTKTTINLTYSSVLHSLPFGAYSSAYLLQCVLVDGVTQFHFAVQRMLLIVADEIN